MSTRSEPWPEGTPCWVDLATTDRQAAADFYGAVFGWQLAYTDDEYGTYGMAMIGDKVVGGVGEPPPDQAVPPAWTTYLASDDVDKTCEAITAAGGTLVVPPMSVGPYGRMAVAQDPTGAFFGVWQAGETIGSTIVNEPGAVGWNECSTRDPQRALDFYAAVFGYSYTAMGGEEPYWTIDGAGPGNTVGGIGAVEAGTPPEVPAHWMTYFVVTDADAAVATATAAGGSVPKGTWDTPFGRMAVIRDPQGAVFSIVGSPPDTAAQ